MTDVFSPVEELRRHGIYGGGASPATEQIINTLSEPQVRAFIDVWESTEVQGQSADAGLAVAMTRVMGWDRPRAQEVGGEVEGMSVAPPAECACLCTGSGGGSGSS